MRGQTIFIGRELERSQICRLLDGIRGQGALVMIGGEPGIGKTRLTQEIALEAGKRKIRTLRGHCFEGEAPTPYLPLVEILEAACDQTPRAEFRGLLGEDAPEVARLVPKVRRMFDDIPPPLELPAGQQQRYLFNAICELIARTARERPLVLVVEDIHWADKPTLLLIEHLARRLGEIPVLMLATYRDVEVDPSGPLARTLEALIRQSQAHPLALKRLDSAGVEAMLRALSAQEPPPALVRTISGETGGNPFFVEEVFNHLAAEGKLFESDGRFRPDVFVGELEVPHGVRLTINLFLGRLGARAAGLLAAAAIAGRKFSFNLIRAVAGLSAEALVEILDELIRARLIEPALPDHEASFVFPHELIRQTVLSNLSQPRRQELHLRVAEAIESLSPGPTDDYTADLAHHLYEAGPMADPVRAVPFLIAAGDRSLDACAFEQALRCFERALSLNSATEHVTAEVEYKRGLAERSLGRWDDARRSWEVALARFEANCESEAAGRICAILNSQLSWAGKFADSIKMGARGLALLGDRVSPDRCKILAANGATLSLAGHHDAGIEMITQARAMAAEIGNTRLIGLTLYSEVIHHYAYMRPRSALEVSLNAIAMLSPHADAWLISDLQIFTIESYLKLGEFDGLDKSYTELKPLAARLGNFVAGVSASRDQMSRQLICSGDIDSWREFVLNDLRECERIHNRAISAGSLSFLGIAEMWRGNWDEALIHLKEGAAREPSGPVGGNWILVAMARAYAGYPAEALAIIDRRHKELARPKQPNSLAAWMISLTAVEVYFVAHQKEQASRLYPLVLEAIDTGVVFRLFDFRLLETVAAIAATAAGNWDAAETHFVKALRISAEIPHRIEQPEVRRFYAQMLIERDGHGDRDQAHGLLAEAIEIYGQVGMPKHREMAEALMHSSDRMAAPPPSAAGNQAANIFRRDGQYWTLGYNGKTVRLKDAKGLRDIACLLAIPGRSLHVADLIAASEGELRDPRGERYAAMSREALREMGLEISTSRNEPLLDAQARKEYSARLAELHRELEEAESIGDSVRTDSARRELDVVVAQLTAAYGLGRRRREPSDPAERARIAVAMRIRNALERIEKEHPALGRHLSRSIRTGTFCCYAQEAPAAWDL